MQNKRRREANHKKGKISDYPILPEKPAYPQAQKSGQTSVHQSPRVRYRVWVDRVS